MNVKPLFLCGAAKSVKICDETKKLQTFKEERKPVFRSTATQFMTIIYSMEYEPINQRGEEYGTKSGLCWDQVGTKLGLGWDEVEKQKKGS